MRREDIQPAYYAMPDVVCPSCLRSGKYGKFHCDVGVVYACSYDGCGHQHTLAWTDLDALKASAQGGKR